MNDSSMIEGRLASINTQLADAVSQSDLATAAPTLIAVSKQQLIQRIEAALAAGHRHFGENRVQEAQTHWEVLKKRYPDVILHLIGPLQSNKAAEAVALFDVIHTVDRPKIAQAIRDASDAQGRDVSCLIQLNTGEEPQKAGVSPKELPDLLHECVDVVGLPIDGLMCIPPAADNPAPHFALLYKLATRHSLAHKSMGMSADYLTAAKLGATYVRVGTDVFGERDSR